MDHLQQKGSPHQGAATHAAHVRESFTCSVGRMQHLRKKKAVKQKRTRDLYYALDPLVPVRSRPPMAEKGCLPSRRTFLQLQDDCRDYLHDLKHPCDSSAPTRRPAVAVHGAPEGGAAQDRGAVSAESMREAMLSSTELLLLEVNTKSWTVQRVSQGLRLLFANHPRVPDTVEGECLLHYVNVSHTVEFERGRCSGA